MDDSVRVRRADVDDAAAIAPFHLRCWHEAYAGFVPRTALDQLDAQDRVEHWRRRLQRQGDTTVLAVDDGVVVGLATAGPSGHHRPRPPVELRSLYVGAAHQGRGTGPALVRAVLGEQEASLWVFVDNARARAFYARTGWRPSGRRRTDAFTGADEVELVRGGDDGGAHAPRPEERR